MGLSLIEFANRERFYEARSAFVDRYCATHAWDATDLTWAQIAEIRLQPEWNVPPSASNPETPDSLSDDACVLCGRTESVNLWATPADNPVLSLNVCANCYYGGMLQKWLEKRCERAMIVHDGSRKLPDGKWKTVYDPQEFG